MEEQNKYWFYRLKGFEKSPYYQNDNDDPRYYDTINIEQDTFIAGNKEEAKQLLINKHGNLPFRKPKIYDLNTKYLWMTVSDEYWYNYHHQFISFTCDNCKNESVIEGRKNLMESEYGKYCSQDCKAEHKNKMFPDEVWINEDDHLGVKKYDKSKIVGYIYQITNKKTMKCYIGQTIKPALFRWWQHLKVDSKFEQMNISDLVFEVIEVVTFDLTDEFDKNTYGDSKSKLNKREAYYIDLYDTVEAGYNTVQPKL